jgi:hypothetical protein
VNLISEFENKTGMETGNSESGKNVGGGVRVFHSTQQTTIVVMIFGFLSKFGRI